MATSSVKKRAITILDNYQLTKYFDAFVFGDEVKRGKPFPDVFLKACKKLMFKK
ncbi:HAD family hydrolase [Coprobacillaceae bacterium CR2/5/TPMF4]|nr:HAD family hydrolase [Coprobacillaceae bacterium CR2/5/TPMF4]